jgi:hypothetical protein
VQKRLKPKDCFCFRAGWSGAQCELCDPTVCPPPPEPEPEPEPGTDSGSWSGSSDYAAPVLPLPPPGAAHAEASAWAKAAQVLLLILGVVGLLWGARQPTPLFDMFCAIYI